MEKLFKLKEHGTDVKTEVIAGATTFLSMVYILAVNPGMLAASWYGQRWRFHRNRSLCRHRFTIYGILLQTTL